MAGGAISCGHKLRTSAADTELRTPDNVGCGSGGAAVDLAFHGKALQKGDPTSPSPTERQTCCPSGDPPRKLRCATLQSNRCSGTRFCCGAMVEASRPLAGALSKCERAQFTECNPVIGIMPSEFTCGRQGRELLALCVAHVGIICHPYCRRRTWRRPTRPACPPTCQGQVCASIRLQCPPARSPARLLLAKASCPPTYLHYSRLFTAGIKG